MKLYLVSGTHPHIPGRRQSLRVTEESAQAEAHSLISAVAADLSYDDGFALTCGWEAHLAAVKTDNAEADFDVWIDELDVELPADLQMPGVLSTLIETGEALADNMEKIVPVLDWIAPLHAGAQPETDRIRAFRDAVQMVRYSALFHAAPVTIPPISEAELEKLKARMKAEPVQFVPMLQPSELAALQSQDVYGIGTAVGEGAKGSCEQSFGGEKSE